MTTWDGRKDFLLQEIGDFLLLETGEKIGLGAPASLWTDRTEPTSAWTDRTPSAEYTYTPIKFKINETDFFLINDDSDNFLANLEASSLWEGRTETTDTWTERAAQSGYQSVPTKFKINETDFFLINNDDDNFLINEEIASIWTNRTTI